MAQLYEELEKLEASENAIISSTINTTTDEIEEVKKD